MRARQAFRKRVALRYSFSTVDIRLTAEEARVLGSLVEKELTTPEYYPLSLNALVNACNQKSNRDPVMHLDERTVSQALRTLESQSLAGPADNYESRVAKFEHRLQEAFNFTRHEIAVLCELLLRRRPASCVAARTACTSLTTWASRSPRCSG
jgi:uncharacterized protein YceH (UPF0502 family)